MNAPPKRIGGSQSDHWNKVHANQNPKPAPSCTPDRSWPAKFLTGRSDAQMITKECFGCGNVTAHQHLHDCAHGIAETHIVGSERFVCELCGHVTRAGSDGAERFPFTFDKVQ